MGGQDDQPPSDPAEAQWRALWAGYLAFYRQRLDAATTDATWRRVLHGREGMIGRVAAANTWAAAPVCYLEDLFVDPAAVPASAAR
jgi:hypothetical protein